MRKQRQGTVNELSRHLGVDKWGWNPRLLIFSLIFLLHVDDVVNAKTIISKEHSPFIIILAEVTFSGTFIA